MKVGFDLIGRRNHPFQTRVAHQPGVQTCVHRRVVFSRLDQLRMLLHSFLDVVGTVDQHVDAQLENVPTRSRLLEQLVHTGHLEHCGADVRLAVDQLVEEFDASRVQGQRVSQMLVDKFHNFV